MNLATTAQQLELQSYASYDDLPAAYEAFFAGAVRSYHDSPDWYRLLIGTGLDPEAEVRLYGVENPKGEPLAFLPARRPAGQAGSRFSGWPLGPRSLAGLTNWQTCLYGPLIAPGVDPDVAMGALVLGLEAEDPPWTFIDFNCLDPKLPSFEALERAFQDCGYATRRYFHVIHMFEDTAGLDYEGYLARRGKTMRKQVPKERRRLARRYDLNIEILTRPEDVPRLLEIYHKLWAASWKPPEAYTQYLETMVRDHAERGALRFGLLSLDGEPAAFKITLVRDGHAYFVRAAYDEKYKESLGSILNAAMIEHVLNVDKVTLIDYGHGDHPHKRHWVSGREERWGLAAFHPRLPRGIRALARFEAENGFQAFKDLIKPAVKPALVRVRQWLGRAKEPRR